MADEAIFSWRDFDNDRQQTSFRLLEGADGIAVWNAMDAEFVKWFAGEKSKGGFFEELSEDLGNGSSNPIAQNSLQAIVEYTDTVTGRGGYTKRIPCPDLAKGDDAQTPPRPAFKPAGGVTVFNPDHTDYPLLVAVLQDNMLSPNDNAVTIDRIYIEE